MGEESAIGTSVATENSMRAVPDCVCSVTYQLMACPVIIVPKSVMA